MKTKKTVWFSAFRHVVPADYENWLEQMASQGWNIDKIGQWSSAFLTFRRGSPKRYRYIYDIQPMPKKDYRTTYEQFGWEFVGQMASCMIWRREYTAERPEAFSDLQSTEKRNRRVFWAVSVSFFMFLAVFVALAILFAATFFTLAAGDIAQYVFSLVLTGGFVLYLAWVMKSINKSRFR